MAQGRKGKLNYRCPFCFMREIDMDMLYDKEKQECYCIRCSFVGKEAEVIILNAYARSRYKDRAIRITKFEHPRKLRVIEKPSRGSIPMKSIRSSTRAAPKEIEAVE